MAVNTHVNYKYYICPKCSTIFKSLERTIDGYCYKCKRYLSEWRGVVPYVDNGGKPCEPDEFPTIDLKEYE